MPGSNVGHFIFKQSFINCELSVVSEATHYFNLYISLPASKKQPRP
jgi:hypothetical protein